MTVTSSNENSGSELNLLTVVIDIQQYLLENLVLLTNLIQMAKGLVVATDLLLLPPCPLLDDAFKRRT